MKDLTDSEYADLCDTIKRLRSERNKIRAELATLRATRDADHGAAIEATARALSSEYLHHQGCGRLRRLASRHMRALVVAVTNSQQKGGEKPCLSPSPTISESQPSTAAPTSDPEGAATCTCKRRIGGPPGSYTDPACPIHGVFATPSPTLEKLAQKIDDLYEAPSRIRPLRRILEREFGASQSVAEATKEIALRVRGLEVLSNIEFIVRDVLFRFREHELLALKAVLEQRTAEANLAVSVGENLQTQLESSRAELRELRVSNDRMNAEIETIQKHIRASMDSEDAFEGGSPAECVALIASQRDNAQSELRELREECERLWKDKERLDWLESHNIRITKPDDCPPWIGAISASGDKIRTAIDAAMQPSEETKP